MKVIMTLMMALLIIGITACTSTKQKDVLNLTDEELQQLCAKKPCELSEDLKRRVVAHSKELKLTPEEMQVFKATGKIILCGKCGYIINSKKFKEANRPDAPKMKDENNDGFADDSIRDRILGPYVN